MVAGESGRVDHRRRAVAEINHVRRVTEPFIDEQIDSRHPPLLLKYCLEYSNGAGYIVK
jgi:hypothetical protein